MLQKCRDASITHYQVLYSLTNITYKVISYKSPIAEEQAKEEDLHKHGNGLSQVFRRIIVVREDPYFILFIFVGKFVYVYQIRIQLYIMGWRQGAYGRPRQKVMINAGRRSRDLASRQEVTSRQEGRCHNIGRCQGHLEHLKMPGHLGDVTDVRTRSNEDIRMDGFHYLLSLWSTQISQASAGGPVQGPGPMPNPAIDDEMLTPSDDEEETMDNPRQMVHSLRRQAEIHARQMAEMQAMINQLTSQLMATPNEKPIKKPKMATPDKYDGNREGLRTFLTTIELYCGYNDVPNDAEKILMANTHLKGKAASWMQPYVEDFLLDINNKGTKDETRTLFSSWANFKEEMGRIFGEVDAESQAEKAISRLRQTKAVSAYTAEFKQLQARINWDDSALRTVYEAGLKENIKDELVHYDKPRDLYSLIELATRIDTRLWERKEAQKGYKPGPPFANTRRYRNNKDHDGDTYMTGKVQDKSKDKNKTRGKFNDGLSKEERQKRYDSKACLRCGEVGHFRRDCPKNEVKQGAVKIGMLRMATPYPTEELDETLSDLDLYDEARQATDEAFELVQKAIGLQDFKWDEPLPTDWQVEGAEVLRRLRNQQCWICGNTRHQANDCDIEGRITITGPRADEIACRAAQEQPRFKESDDEETPRTFKERMEQHERLRWVDCPRQCDYHLRKREETRNNEDDCCHINLWHNECRVQHCQVHQPGEKEAHEELCWINCTTNCQFHREQRRNARKVDDYYHSTISAEECNAKNCRMHRAARPRVTMTRVPRQDQGKSNEEKSHERLLWTHCRKGCAFHRQQFEDARGVNDYLHSTLSANICEADGCPIHRTKKPSPTRKVAKDDIPHPNIHWSFCYDDQCTIHYSAKEGEGYFPKQRKGCRQGQGHAGEGSPKTTLKEVRELGAQDLRLQATVLIDGHEVTALIDSGAARTVISPRVVEKNNIPYRAKKVPMRVVLADDSPTTYGNGWIRLETEAVSLRLAGQESRTKISIMDLGETEMIIGYDWLLEYNPAIDWQKKSIHSREPVHKVAGVRRETRPTDQRAHPDGRFGVISPHKIARIYAKDPQRVGVIWIRQVATTKEGPVPQVASANDEPLLAIPAEYRTSEFKELFEENEATDLAEHQDWDHEIILEEGAKLSPGGMYPIAPEHDAELRDYLQKNLKKGFIRPGSGPMASPILFVKKPNGKWRLCVDFRRLNSVTRKNRYPLPLITELMDRLQGAKWFTKFDVREGFYRIRIKEGHEWMTAFKTKYGLFEYTVMPFGLTNAPATFQSVINNALHEYLGIFVTAYLDDVLVYSSGTREEHVEHVKKVLRKLKEYKLYLQPGKCEFHTQETEFLGFIISTEGVKMNPKKIQTVQEWPKPNTVKDVQSFLGFANYYRKFIKDYSKITAPLTEITKKEIGFKWEQEHQEAFDRIKQIFLEAPVLEMYSPQRPTRVETDASDYALGAVLSQQCTDKKWRPVFYHSRKFLGAELNYDVHDKELLGVVDAFEQWEVYLLGLPDTIEVFTDHQNLTSFMTTKKLNRRQVRWAETLAQFDFKITHRAGTLNGAADALSRRSDLREEGHKEPHDALLKTMPDGSLKYNQPELAKVAKVAEQVETLQQQWQQQAASWQFEPDETGSDGLLNDEREYRDMVSKDRTYVPPHMRSSLIQELHESTEYGHAGIEEMVRRLSKVFAIPRMRTKVQEILGNCLACHQNKPKRHKPYGLLQPLQPPSRPWTSVTMDFIVKLPRSLEPGSARFCDTILVIVDRLTKAAKFVPTEETITAEECAYEVTKALVSEHGIPEEFITDRDKLFTSKYWNTFLAKLGVKKKLSTSFHPETDGQTERTNQTLEQYLRMYANKLQDNWVELLPTAQLAYNSTRSATTKHSPHYANYGYEPVAHRDPKDIESIAVGADDKAKLMRDLHEELSKNIAQRNLTTSKAANKQRIEGPTFKKGDKVFLSRQNLKTKRPCRKLDNLRVGPFKILEEIGKVNYKLKLPQGMRIHPVFHKKLLEPAPPDAELATDIELEDDEYEVEEVKDLRKIGSQWKYLVKWQGWPESHNTWEPEGNLTNCKSLVRDFHRRQPRYTQHNGRRTFQRSNVSSSPHSAYNENPFRHPPLQLAKHEHASVQSKFEHGGHVVFGPWAWLGRLESGKGRTQWPGAHRPYMQLTIQHAARQNDNPGYRDDTPKRGDNVTSNKKDSLLDEGMEAGSLWTSTSEGNDQRGA
ncbi:reverse transcriptase [Bipolaris maydis]|nr:reverse transcriptase [Bipolaris maydis]